MNKRIVFLPGFLCDESLWSVQAQSLSQEFETVVVDFKPAQNLEEMIRQIANVTNEASHIVGFSMGGYLAQVFALKYPEKIQSLSLVAANVGALSPRMRESRLKMAGMLKNANYKGMSQKELSNYIHPDSAANSAIVEKIIQMSAGFTSQMYINQMLSTLDREDLSERINELNLPVLIVGADGDKVVPLQTLEDFHNKIESSRFIKIERSGHYIPVERPDDVTEVLATFLKSL